MKDLLLQASVSTVVAKDRAAARAARMYDREQGASLVEQIIITVLVAVAVVAIVGGLIIPALTSQGQNTADCIKNPTSCRTGS